MSAAHRDEIAKLESLYAENPEGRVFTHLAEAYRKAGELDRAREILSSGIERHPDYSSAHVVLGRVLMDQGEGQEADAAFRRVLELDPHNLIAMRSRADIARDRGDDETAMVLYSRLLDQEPGDEEVRDIVEGMKAGDGAAQEPAAQEPAAQEPADAFSYGDLEEDEEDGEDAELRTETIAQVYARQGLYDRAAEVYRELSRARPEDDSLRERLAEMEQLAEAQSGTSDEVDAVSDFDSQREEPSRDGSPWEDAPWEDAPWEDAPWNEPDQPAAEESPWSTSVPDEADEAEDAEDADEPAPWEQTPMTSPDPAGLDAADAATDEPATEEPATEEPVTDESVTDESVTDESVTGDPELGEMPAAGAYHDQWKTEGQDEVESDDPDVFHVEGLESSEVDTSGAGAERLADIEFDEVDPESGLRTGATPDTAAPEEDLSEEMDVRDVPEPPAERPWEVGAAGAAGTAGTGGTGGGAEPEWLSGVGAPEAEEVGAEEAEGEEAEAAESIWVGADWDDGAIEETTPHAWTQEDEEAVDPSPPVRDYFGGLLGWSGGQAPREETSPEPAPREEPSADVSGTSDLPGAADRSEASDLPGEDDDDLDMFRSWLESLKQ